MNVLIIGLGSIARKHIEALQVLKVNAKIYALRSNPDAEIVGEIENVYDLENLNIDFDFAIISNPTHLHYEFIEKLAKKNIPLFIEKPAVNTLEHVNQLVDIIESKKLITYVACNLRFHPCIVYLKNKINSGILRVNELNVYCGSYLPDWRPGKDFRAIYSSNAKMGGGVHLDLFHELDYTTWLFGLPNKSKSYLRNSSSLAIDAIDYANYTLEYDRFTANIILNYYRRKPKREIEIVLDENTWTIDLIKNEVRNDNNECLFKTSNFNVKDTYVLQLEYFINSLKSKETPMNSFKDSLEILKICLNGG
ncbi:Gfo/Idh/MocA family oxidoreductase [Pedobacter aquatilis]|uniref:Gfo/Idh/MocA family protein n=1 Tax=Pedobacter aquatilis TaxID=351343 RepID=UPI00292F040B|nr:Gfo/Idh/MocA family oxidoreductase [Pedobacter aquatilis]